MRMIPTNEVVAVGTKESQGTTRNIYVSARHKVSELGLPYEYAGLPWKVSEKILCRSME